MGFTIFEASVSDYAVTGNDVGTGSLLAALADAGFLIGLKRNRFVILVPAILSYL
jgi:alpha-N-arabinofuranosidase